MIAWLSLFTVIITGITLFLQYLLGDKRQFRILQERKLKLEKELRIALAKNDSVRISVIALDLHRVRQKIANRSR